MLINGKEVRFRCSKVGLLMCEPKSKAAKEAGELGDTAKSYVEEVWMKNEYGYEDVFYDKEVSKGTFCEQDSIELVNEVLGGEFRVSAEHNNLWKDKLPLKNDYIAGTPDIILSNTDYVEDIKTSFTLKTFLKADIKPIYYWQGVSYMALTGKKRYRLIYCLVNTPDYIVRQEIKNYWFKFLGNPDSLSPEEIEDYLKIESQLEKNHKYNHIPPQKRIKIFEFEFKQEDYDKLITQCNKGFEYYKTLKL